MNNLDIDAINLKAPYKVSLIDGKEYQFTTNKGIIYRVGFIPDDSIYSCETFQFYISRETIHHSTKDLNVEPTIITILERFFEDNQSVILYICDTSDGKEAARNRLFVHWFNNNLNKDRYICKSAHTEVENVGMYAAIIVRIDNPFVSKVCEEFDETARILTEKPDES